MARGRDMLRGSILDRLTGQNGADGAFGSIDYRELKIAVRRDLNWLLNTRAWLPEELDGLPETRSSVLMFGVEDFTPLSWTRHGDRKTMCKALEDAIRTFEHRLIPRTVRVVPPDEDEEFDAYEEPSMRVRLRIEAVLNVEPYNEPVSFDTEVDVDARTVHVGRPT